MQSTVKQIYEKHLGYRETERDDKEYRERKEEYNKAFEMREATLNKEQKEMLSELFICEGGVEDALEYLSFKDGFFAGIRLGIDLCDEKK